VIVGNPDQFAIESQIDLVDVDEHFRAWGAFGLHVGGVRYGVWEDGCTSFSNSPGEVQRLLSTRGSRTQPERQDRPAFELADQWLDVNFRVRPRTITEHERISVSEILHTPACYWPEMDREFDDGSTVLLFDVGDKVRIVAFKNSGGNDVTHLSDQVLPANAFYEVLAGWLSAFEKDLAERRREFGAHHSGYSIIRAQTKSEPRASPRCPRSRP
jgi:hypothetical protein